MFDIGWTEMLVIAMLALIIIGPKDLPGTLRTVGQWVRKARSLAREFQSGVDEMVREAELDDARKALEATKRGNLTKRIAEAVDPDGELDAEAKALRSATRIEEPGRTTAKADAEAERSSKPTSGGSEADETPGAKVVKHPAKIAPGNSVRPPEEQTQEAPAELAPKTPPKPGETGAETGTAATTENTASKAGGSIG
ncbi:Sec-independent protein translocase protein TatB [Algihabitans albus]|uniref:Sec-independent protein translocase protein TatB n=1 Tax=Algihabitans albus TaxID=2164067 RepID=UPI000E5D6B40|nr:Sec-independent protein translocase protein TatB [Algihabitans albus]